MNTRLSTLFATMQSQASIESVSDDGVEREYVFYGKMTQPADLDKALRYEDQEQWRIVIPCKEDKREMLMRVRRVVRVNRHDNGDWESPCDPEYYLTIKTYILGDPGTTEVEKEISPMEGEALLKVIRSEGDGMVKRRYYFPCGSGYYPDRDDRIGVRMKFDEDVVWEVDVFFAKDSGPNVKEPEFAPYVKLDLELRRWSLKVHKDEKTGEFDGFSVPFPIHMTDVIYSQPHERTDRDAKRVKKIMDRYMKA